MSEYRCRFCGWWLFNTSQPFGRIWIKCPNRRCEQAQWVEYTGQQARDLQTVPA